MDFVERSESLRILYKVPSENGFKEYFKNIKIQSLSKTEIQQNEILSEPIVFECLSLWYEENMTVFTIKPQKNELRWNFRWNSRFKKYNTRSLKCKNNGHVEAPILMEITGYIKNPKLELYIDKELYQTVSLNVEIEEYEKLLYGTKEDEFYINRQRTDGTLESLFSLEVIKFENDNVIRLPVGKLCELRLTAENEIKNAQITILNFYKVV